MARMMLEPIDAEPSKPIRHARFAAAAGSGCTCANGATRRARRSCSSTAGRSASCAGRGRSPVPLATGLPARHLRPPRPRHVGEAAQTPTPTATRGCGPTTSTAVIEETRLDRPVVVAWSYGGYVVTDYLRVLRREAIGRRRPRRRRRAAAAAAVRPLRPGPARERRRRMRAAICRRTSPPSSASFAPAPCGRSATTTGRPALCWNMVVPPEIRGALFAREIDADEVLVAPVGPGPRDARAPTDRAARRWRSTCSRFARRPARPGTTTSATCRSSRTRPVRPRARRVRRRRPAVNVERRRRFPARSRQALPAAL